MREPPLTQHVVRLNCALYVSLVHADRYPHQHVLGPLNNFAIHP